MAHAQSCVAKACELRPQLPHGFNVAAVVFMASRMDEMSYMYAEKVRMSAGPGFMLTVLYYLVALSVSCHIISNPHLHS